MEFEFGNLVWLDRSRISGYSTWADVILMILGKDSGEEEVYQAICLSKVPGGAMQFGETTAISPNWFETCNDYRSPAS